MNRTLYLAVLMCLPMTATQSAPQQLPTITINAEDETPHLTTRIQWVKFPQIHYQSADLVNQDRSAIVRVYADKTGKIINSDIQESTGIKILDQKLLNAIQNAELKPTTKEGKAVKLIGYQTFTLKLNDAVDKAASKQQCSYPFNSHNWLKQAKGKSVPFAYLQQPQLQIPEDLLKDKDRVVKFKFKINQLGEVTQVKLKKRSGVNTIDQQIIAAVEQSKVDAKRSYRTLWMYKKMTLNDKIELKINECH
ncbi:TonB family protein [Acinetobacter sp. ANC 4648]|uniref:TonB family protein n=1 Tax=Acinetobacter sp. ANC 4648 TaxID=1977875 RepID=UPI000A334A1A|nr:TonB family protein [Acinetobacter sp. ANC 4648]OTG84674.1 TonB-dependent receptor [Acinetobacter sp. ANC 4648]